MTATKINRDVTRNIKTLAIKFMNNTPTCKHVVYGYCYADLVGNIFELLYKEPEQFKCFYDDLSYEKYCHNLLKKLFGGMSINIYALHQNETYDEEG